MPWNDNANPGPWGSPPSGGDDDDKKGREPPRRPLGGPRGPRRPEGPEINAFIERLMARLREMFGGSDGRGVKPATIAAAAGVAFALWAASGIYFVQPNEEAVVTTFGAYTRSAGPGMRYHLPAPIEHVEKVPVTNVNSVEIGGVAGDARPEESLMLTGDGAIVDLGFSVQWRVSDADQYVFTLKDQQSAIRDIAESAMREVVGKTSLEAILTGGRGKVQTDATALMQRTLDSWKSGVRIVQVQVRSANPPGPVVQASRDLQNARQDAERAENEANAYRNRVINEAKGDAAKLTQSAQGYREQAVREATGDAARFNQIYAEYRRAPGVTRERLYIETMQRVLARSNKVVVDSQGASAPIILPPDVFRPRAPTTAPPVVVQAQPSEASQPGVTR